MTNSVNLKYQNQHYSKVIRFHEHPILSPKLQCVVFLGWHNWSLSKKLYIYILFTYCSHVRQWSADRPHHTSTNVLLPRRSYSSTCLFIWLLGTEKIKIYRVMSQVRRFQHELPCNWRR